MARMITIGLSAVGQTETFDHIIGMSVQLSRAEMPLSMTHRNVKRPEPACKPLNLQAAPYSPPRAGRTFLSLKRRFPQFRETGRSLIASVKAGAAAQVGSILRRAGAVSKSDEVRRCACWAIRIENDQFCGRWPTLTYSSQSQ